MYDPRVFDIGARLRGVLTIFSRRDPLQPGGSSGDRRGSRSQASETRPRLGPGTAVVIKRGVRINGQWVTML